MDAARVFGRGTADKTDELGTCKRIHCWFNDAIICTLC